MTGIAQDQQPTLEDSWWTDDYSWDGLAKKPWATGAILGNADGGVPPHAFGEISNATLQDYWRAERNFLIPETDTEGRVVRHWTRFHCPLVFESGQKSPKATWTASDWNALQRDVQAKLEAADVTLLDGPSVVGPDLRAQLAGVVIRTLPKRANEILSISAFAARFLDDVHLAHQLFAPGADFAKAVFCKTSHFSGANFRGSVSFREAVFSGYAEFYDVAFSGLAYFDRAIFDAECNFRRTRFAQANFGSTSFHGYANFEDTTFSGGANRGDANFTGAVFENRADFLNAEIVGHAFFGEVDFRDRAFFNGGKFLGEANFFKARFSEYAGFQNSVFAGGADFLDSSFSDDADFRSTDFSNSKWIVFKGAKFARLADFSSISLPASATAFRQAFLDVVFMSLANFQSDVFVGFSMFDGAIFNGQVLLTDSIFQGDYAFREAHRACREGKRDVNDHLTSLERGFRVLKRCASDRNDWTSQQRYYRYEFMARELQMPSRFGEFVDWLFLTLYGRVSDYGFGVRRPIASLVWTVFIFAIAAWTTAAKGLIIRKATDGHWGLAPNWADAVHFSIFNVFRPFSIWDVSWDVSTDPSHADSQLVWMQHLIELNPLAVRLAATCESFLAGLFLFLLALALRRRFQVS